MSDSGSRKDFWDKLGALSTLFSSVIIGAVGLWATSAYNHKQLQINQMQQQQQADIALTKELEDLYPYLSDKDAGKRKFGYAMFVALGKEDLALSLINANSDAAGQPIAESLATSTSPATALHAFSVVNSLKLHQWLAPGAAQSASTETPSADTSGSSGGSQPASPAASAPAPGAQIDQGRLGALQGWMNRNASNPALKGVPVEALLNSTNPALEAARARAVSELIKSRSGSGSP